MPGIEVIEKEAIRLRLFLNVRTVHFIFLLADVFAGRLDREVRTGNAVLPGRPGAQVRQLTALRAERTPAVPFPGDWLTTERAIHARILPCGSRSRRVSQLGRIG
jgi:hypothetical protein